LRPGGVHPSGHPLTPQRVGSLAGATHGRLAGATRYGYLPLFVGLGEVASQPLVMHGHALLDRSVSPIFIIQCSSTNKRRHPKVSKGRSESPLVASADAIPLRSFPRVAAHPPCAGTPGWLAYACHPRKRGDAPQPRKRGNAPSFSSRERSKEGQRGGRILRPGSVHPSGHPLTPQRVGGLAGATHGRLAGATRGGYLPLFVGLGEVASQPHVMRRLALLDRRGLAVFCQAEGPTSFVAHPKECRGRSESPLLASADAIPPRPFPCVAARPLRAGTPAYMAYACHPRKRDEVPPRRGAPSVRRDSCLHGVRMPSP